MVQKVRPGRKMIFDDYGEKMIKLKDGKGNVCDTKKEKNERKKGEVTKNEEGVDFGWSGEKNFLLWF